MATCHLFLNKGISPLPSGNLATKGRPDPWTPNTMDSKEYAQLSLCCPPLSCAELRSQDDQPDGNEQIGGFHPDLGLSRSPIARSSVKGD